MLRKGLERGARLGVELADGVEQTDHPLLEQILAVTSRQKIRADANLNDPAVAKNELARSIIVALGGEALQLLISQCGIIHGKNQLTPKNLNWIISALVQFVKDFCEIVKKL